MALPPLLTGAVKVTLAAVVSPGVAAPIVGTPGTPPGVALLETAEATLVPTALVAVTVKV
jgi:hypothetical protein